MPGPALALLELIVKVALTTGGGRRVENEVVLWVRHRSLTSADGAFDSRQAGSDPALDDKARPNSQVIEATTYE